MSKINCVQIELTNHCNYKCAMCPRSPKQLTRSKGMMELGLAKKVIDEAFKIGTFINFSFFGEPLLHPQLFEILDYTKRKPKGFKVVMNTNLSLATKEIFNKFIDVGVSSLRISVDAATPETYNIMRPSSYVLDLSGEKLFDDRLDVIDEKLRWWFSKHTHISTRHVVPVSSLNKHEIIDYVKKWYEFLGKGDSILLKSVLTYGGKIKDSMITQNPCNVWKTGVATVDHSGNVSPCNLDTDMNLIIGNVKSMSLSKLWGNKKHKQIESSSKQKKIYPCNSCVDANNYTKNITITNRTLLSDSLFRRISNTYELI